MRDTKPTSLLTDELRASFIKWGESKNLDYIPDGKDGYSYRAYQTIRSSTLFSWDYIDRCPDSHKYHILKMYFKEVHSLGISGFSFEEMDAGIITKVKYLKQQ
ncbi:hypothetical protein M1M25_gp067 [Tenacibaculum phage Gundel_1]|uniref:Uncharacterized protein n=1 Tax=Tenacibaculum phage Gundel_1 TaxID=2745672 RepID=A0A8E4ZMW8_9CAUD|nr:hypothetical protein M1M25_gp067 [Tenacibaculum phage Gundel_1]QQV91502.1 hypothetical protein Gundel1_67 [Tenacibaculum phage Gundel_1]